MNSKFFKWYTQALGSTLGIITCLYSYLNGDMFVYKNIGRNFDSLDFGGMLASYTLFPLCIISLILAIVKSFTYDNEKIKTSVSLFNNIIITTTVIIGLLGTKFYFLLPSAFILASSFIALLHIIQDKKMQGLESVEKSSSQNEDVAESTIEYIEEDSKCISEVNTFENIKDDSSKIMHSEQMFEEDEEEYKTEILLEEKLIDKKYLAKREMAIDLLNKDAAMDFIIDISGLTADEIILLKEEISINLESAH